MKDYPDFNDILSGQVNEPISTYGSPLSMQGKKEAFSASMMDELLRQDDDVKLWIIQQLSGSMMSKRQDGADISRQSARRKLIEAKLDELHITGSLRRLVGAVPSEEGEEDDWKKKKEAYLTKKYER